MTHDEFSDALVDYIMNNRRMTTFSRLSMFNETIPLTRLEVERLLMKGFKERSCVWTSEEGEVTGVAIGHADHNRKIFNCRDILTSNNESFLKLIEMFAFLFPNYTLTARRKGKEVTYNTERFLKHFIKEHAY